MPPSALRVGVEVVPYWVMSLQPVGAAIRVARIEDHRSGVVDVGGGRVAIAADHLDQLGRFVELGGVGEDRAVCCSLVCAPLSAPISVAVRFTSSASCRLHTEVPSA